MNDPKTTKEPWGKKIRGQFLAGVLVVVPVGASILILVWIFTSIDNILQPLIKAIFGNPIPGVGFAATIILIYIIGIIAKNVIGKRVIQYGESLLSKVPVFRQLSNGIRQILEAFASPNKTGFMQVVLVEFPREGMRAMAFVTNELKDTTGEKLLSVLIPTSPNPTSGFLQIVKEKDIIRTNVSVDEALKMIVSAGRMTPDEVQDKIKSDKII